MHVAAEPALRAANVTLLLGAVCIVLGLYKPTAILQTRMLFLTVTVAALFAVPIFWGVLGDPDVAPVFLTGPKAWQVGAMAGWLMLLAGTRLFYATAIRRGILVRTVTVVGDGSMAADLVVALRGTRPCLFDVTHRASGAVPPKTEARPWRVVMAGEDVRPGTASSARVVDVHSFWETQFGRVNLHSLQYPAITAAIAKASRAGFAAALIRRTLDIAGATTLLVLAGPLMLLIALAVRLDSRGPVIYSQARMGLGGRPFTILKFRSMRADAERDGVALWASVRDSRVTRVGAFIRKVRLDELPQLVNILRGDMSLVGPRPERPSLAAAISADTPSFALRTLVKPGLTGWAQINSAYTASTVEAREKLSFDLYYVKNRTLALDLMIIIATVRILIFQVGSR